MPEISLGRSHQPSTTQTGGQMPRIVVTTEPRVPNSGSSVLLDERIVTADLDSDHFAAQLIERIGWALLDADGAERRPGVR
jgi:hypothetical protein